MSTPAPGGDHPAEPRDQGGNERWAEYQDRDQDQPEHRDQDQPEHRDEGRDRGWDERRDQRRDEGRDQGGDPACWMARVCPDCGRFATDDPPTTCERCGAELPAAP